MHVTSYLPNIHALNEHTHYTYLVNASTRITWHGNTLHCITHTEVRMLNLNAILCVHMIVTTHIHSMNITFTCDLLVHHTHIVLYYMGISSHLKLHHTNHTFTLHTTCVQHMICLNAHQVYIYNQMHAVMKIHHIITHT